MSLWHFFSFSFLFRFKSHHPACQSYLNFVYLLLTCFVLLSLILQKQKPASSSSPYQHVNWMKLFMYLLCYIGYIHKLIWIFQGLYTSSPYFHPLVSQCRLNFFTVSHFFLSMVVPKNRFLASLTTHISLSIFICCRMRLLTRDAIYLQIFTPFFVPHPILHCAPHSHI